MLKELKTRIHSVGEVIKLFKKCRNYLNDLNYLNNVGMSVSKKVKQVDCPLKNCIFPV